MVIRMSPSRTRLRGRFPRSCRTWMLVVVVFFGLMLSGCGQGDNDAADSTGDTEAPGVNGATEATGSVRTAPSEGFAHGMVIGGSFRGVPEDKYTVDVNYSLTGLAGDVQLANVPPGEAEVVPTAEAELEIANTTPQRETYIGEPNMDLMLLYDKGSVPIAVINGTSNLVLDWYDICQLEHAGQVYCAVGEFSFGLSDSPDGSLPPDELAPDQSLSLLQERDPRGLVVDEAAADTVANFIDSRPPDLILVKPGSARATLGIACKYYISNNDVHPEIAYDRVAVALLDGDGTVIRQPPLEGHDAPTC